MRNIKNVKLDAHRQATLQELRVRDVRRFLGEAKTLENISVQDLIGTRFHELPGLLGDCLQLPEGETLDDLSFSDIEQIKTGFIEVNAAFLDLLGLAGLLPQGLPSASLTAPVPSSSNEAT